MFSTMKKGLFATTMMVSAGVAAQSVAAEDMVALLLPENATPRWESQDAAAFVRTMAQIAPNVKVDVFNAATTHPCSRVRRNRRSHRVPKSLL